MATRPSCLLLPLTLRLSLYSLPPPCESTPQLDAQTRGVRFKGSLTSDRGFFSSVKQRVRFHSIRKVNSKARRRRCEENTKGGGIKGIAMMEEEMKEERERRSKKKITSAGSFSKISSFHPSSSSLFQLRYATSVQPLPRNSTLLPFCFLPGTLSSLPSMFSTSTYTINDCTPTRPARPDGKTNARKCRRRG